MPEALDRNFRMGVHTKFIFIWRYDLELKIVCVRYCGFWFLPFTKNTLRTMCKVVCWVLGTLTQMRPRPYNLDARESTYNLRICHDQNSKKPWDQREGHWRKDDPRSGSRKCEGVLRTWGDPAIIIPNSLCGVDYMSLAGLKPLFIWTHLILITQVW